MTFKLASINGFKGQTGRLIVVAAALLVGACGGGTATSDGGGGNAAAGASGRGGAGGRGGRGGGGGSAGATAGGGAAGVGFDVGGTTGSGRGGGAGVGIDVGGTTGSGRGGGAGVGIDVGGTTGSGRGGGAGVGIDVGGTTGSGRGGAGGAAGRGGAGGAAGRGGAGGMTGATCSPTCARTDYCHAPNSCMGAGTCTPRPMDCITPESIVCGCDGKLYRSACDANASGGVDTQSLAGCPAPAGMFRCGTIFCTLGTQYCRVTPSATALSNAYACLDVPAGCGATQTCDCILTSQCNYCTMLGSGDVTLMCVAP